MQKAAGTRRVGFMAQEFIKLRGVFTLLFSGLVKPMDVERLNGYFV